ncbi:MAG: GNAT family N-acetyltransferase [Chlamydiales bacterium]
MASEAVSSSQMRVSQNLSFQDLKSSSNFLDVIIKTFFNSISPIYGDQSKSLAKIISREDRRCKVLFDDQAPVGILVYKDKTQDEFAKYGVANSLEIKTLVVIDSEKNSGKGYGTELIKKAISAAQFRGATGMHVTTSQKAESATNFFTKKNFKVMTVFGHDNEFGVQEGETLLYRTLEKVEKQRQAISSSSTDRPQKKRAKTLEQDRDLEKTFSETRDSKKRKIKHTSDLLESDQPPPTHSVTLKGKYLSQIKSGHKKVEGRIYSGQFTRYKVNDIVRFYNHEDEVRCQITAVKICKTFREMLTHFGVRACLPDVDTIEEGVGAYHSIRSFPEREFKHGVVGFKFRLV